MFRISLAIIALSAVLAAAQPAFAVTPAAASVAPVVSETVPPASYAPTTVAEPGSDGRGKDIVLVGFGWG